MTPGRICRVPLLALCMTLSAHVPAAMAQGASSPDVWSIQLHGGQFATIDGSGTSPMVGMRYSKHYSPHVYGGMLTGLSVMSRSLEASSQSANGSRVEFGKVDARIVPLMGFIQVNLTDKARLVPLIGFGAGYEWLSLDVKDHLTGSSTRSNYGNIAWETYGGVAVRMTAKVRVNGELFYNGGALERRARDENGSTWFEVVHVNGIGARLGLDMDFE